MARVALDLYFDPTVAETYIAVELTNDRIFRASAVIDTGAHTSLFPKFLLDEIAYDESNTETVIIEQAGIAQQSFQATKAFVRIFIEDLAGNRTTDLEIPAWFADTELVLLGFDGFLDRATLYINMRNAREGWIEMD